MLKNGFEHYPVCKNLTGPLCGKMGEGNLQMVEELFLFHSQIT